MNIKLLLIIVLVLQVILLWTNRYSYIVVDSLKDAAWRINNLTGKACLTLIKERSGNYYFNCP